MPRNRRFWLGPVVAAAGLVTLAGCQSPGAGPAGNALLESAGVDRKNLTPGQLADLQVAYGRSLEKRGEHDQARTRYSEAVKHDPERADAWHRLAVLHDRQGKFSESAEMYQRALALRPGDPDVYCDVGYSLYLQRRWEEAEMNLRQAVALRGDHARAHNNLGLLLARTGKEDAALAEFRQAGCSEADARTNTAFALTLERRWPEAQRHYRRALDLDSSNRLAKKGLESLQTVMAKLPPGHDRASAPDAGEVTATSWRDEASSPER
jgi:Tfp pilus assembly protein PilF